MEQETLVTELLNEAFKLLETKGWIQKATSNSKGYCSLGALSTARNKMIKKAMVSYTSLSPFDTIYWKAKEKLRKVVGGGSIIHWNDTTGRTKEEILEAFRKAKELEPC